METRDRLGQDFGLFIYSRAEQAGWPRSLGQGGLEGSSAASDGSCSPQSAWGRGLGVEVGVRGEGGGKEEGGEESETNKLVKDEDGIKEMFQEMQFVELGQGRAQPPRNPDCCAAPLTPNSH